VGLEEEVVNIISRDPTTINRRISAKLGIPRTSVWNILKKEGLHLYHYHRSHNLIFGDNVARSIFCMWFLREHRINMDFVKHILWTDEATFTRGGIQTIATHMSRLLKIRTLFGQLHSNINFQLMFVLE
jgi:hypothetical protein